MKVGDKVIVDPRLHECIWCIPMEEVKGKIMTIISINSLEVLRLIVRSLTVWLLPMPLTNH